MGKMDLDQPLASGSKQSLAPAPASSHPEDRLGLSQFGELNKLMNKMSLSLHWPAHIDAIGDDDSEWRLLLRSSILVNLKDCLVATDLKDSVVANVKLRHIGTFVESFDKDSLEKWKAGVRSCLGENDWSVLIPYLNLQKPNIVIPDVALGAPIEQKHAVIEAWNREYLGDAYKALLAAIDEVHSKPIEENYAKIVPVAQSSGTGKSKTVDKIAGERILIPLCLREDLDRGFAYPPTDKAVRDYLLSAPSTSQEEQCKDHIRSFLSSLFKSTLHLAEHFWPADETVSYVCMAAKFYDFFAVQSQRDQFYGEVVENARKDPSAKSWESFRLFRNGLKRGCSDWPASLCPLLISMDEVHVLYDQRIADRGSNYTLYSRLKSVLSEVVVEALCTIFLSTASSVSKLAPSKKLAPSLRERENERFLPVPFTELPFDAHIIAEPLVPGQATLSSVGSLEFTAKFGRPWFYANYLSRKNKHGNDNIDGIMRNVRDKLCGHAWPPDKRADLDATSIAVLSSRLLLDLSPTTSDAQRYDKELVRNHLRMLYSVHRNQEVIVTGSSSEPLIAEAAAQIMHFKITENGNTVPYMDFWHLLGKFVEHGLAAQGAIGGLIGRALSISAMDRAIHGLPKNCELNYQMPVTVADYYKALLTDESWEALRKSTPANRAQLTKISAMTTFEDAFKNAYFHFSHYAKANDSSPMCETYAWANWLRGTAVVCQLNQELSDRMMPIYFSNRGGVSPQSVSVNLNQDKTGQSADPRYIGIQSAEKLSVFSHGHRLPYIAAAHCYGLTEKQGTTVTKSINHNFRGKPDDQEAPRYQIDIRGLDAYGNVTDTVKNVIRMMINRSKNAIFMNHSRTYNVPFLRRMLPVLTQDSASTEWFGGFASADAWSASYTPTANPPTAGPKKRKAMPSTGGPPEKKQKGKRKA